MSEQSDLSSPSLPSAPPSTPIGLLPNSSSAVQGIHFSTSPALEGSTGSSSDAVKTTSLVIPENPCISEQSFGNILPLSDNLTKREKPGRVLRTKKLTVNTGGNNERSDIDTPQFPRTPFPGDVMPQYLWKEVPNALITEQEANLRQHWQVNYSFDLSAPNENVSPVVMQVFLSNYERPAFDKVRGDDELIKWATSENALRVGSYGISPNLNYRSTNYRGGDREGERVVIRRTDSGENRGFSSRTRSGSIPLTKALANRIGESLEEEAVLPYLRRYLGWIVRTEDGEIVKLATLKVSIATTPYEHYKEYVQGQSKRLPSFTLFDTFYEGRVGKVK